MKFVALIKSMLTTVAFAAGQFFAWLNRREQREEQDEIENRTSDLMSAAAKPSEENADIVNRWLARGRSGRLRRKPRQD